MASNDGTPEYDNDSQMTGTDERTRWPIAAARAADDNVGTNTLVIDVGEVLAITEFFVITSGNNNRQVRAITDAVEQGVTADGGPKPTRIEGLDSFDWVLIDYGDFVVHVLSTDAREYYELERLWRDQPQIEWLDPETRAARAAGSQKATSEEE